jgi:hypothetical protein
MHSSLYYSSLVSCHHAKILVAQAILANSELMGMSCKPHERSV